ncbi:hypothetical protein ACFC09_02125 [Streptomyces sp. NPDC056161]|uniref:hypothetical protein n=1 Tax=Streptomyces sp. NPDC056161 TaxID=3345732 RepID=UPI0035D674DC
MTRSVPTLRTATVIAAAFLGAAAAPAAAGGPEGAVKGGSLITVLDNSQADSILEVDRTANLQTGRGTAGSDHDGSAVDAIQALMGEDASADED